MSRAKIIYFLFFKNVRTSEVMSAQSLRKIAENSVPITSFQPVPVFDCRVHYVLDQYDASSTNHIFSNMHFQVKKYMSGK